MRNKLIELLANAFDERTVKCLDCFDNDECLDRGYCDDWTADIADHLIANGVTIGKDTNVLGKKHLTNADRIRGMSDEELVTLFDCFNVCNVCEENERLEGDNPFLVFKECDNDCEAHISNWLKQPVEGEHG